MPIDHQRLTLHSKCCDVLWPHNRFFGCDLSFSVTHLSLNIDTYIHKLMSPTNTQVQNLFDFLS